MGAFTLFSSKSRTSVTDEQKQANPTVSKPSTSNGVVATNTTDDAAVLAEKPPVSEPPSVSESSETQQQANSTVMSVEAAPVVVEEAPARRKPAKRFSFRLLPRASHDPHKPALSATADHEKRLAAESALQHKRITVGAKSRADKRAYESALAVRALIAGPAFTASSPEVSSVFAKPQMSRIKEVKSQLMEPVTANRLIAHLRALPATAGDKEHAEGGLHVAAPPIHAVCLEHTDQDMDTNHFARLSGQQDQPTAAVRQFSIPTVANAGIQALEETFNDLHIINLIKSPDFGLGQPGDGEGLLAGAVPTAETIISGIEQITPQLMALGYATGKSIIPNHSGVYPPTDRMSILTYWWGLELCLPPPTLAHLKTAESISGTMMNFLSALAVMNEGVREILPFVRYISQFVDFEFGAIQQQNHGRGVVCCATWIMPAAMIPRPWDFSDPPPKPDPVSPSSQDEETAKPVAPSTQTPVVPSSRTPAPLHLSLATEGTAQSTDMPSGEHPASVVAISATGST